jgi:hypothetical protein
MSVIFPMRDLKKEALVMTDCKAAHGVSYPERVAGDTYAAPERFRIYKTLSSRILLDPKFWSTDGQPRHAVGN